MKPVSRKSVRCGLSRGITLEFGGWLVLAVFFGMFNYLLSLWTTKTDVSLHIQTETSGVLQIYWRSRAQGFTEKQSVSLRLEPHINSYQLRIPAPSQFSFLRIDPLNKPGRMEIDSITFDQSFHFPVMIDFQQVLVNQSERSDLAAITLTSDKRISFTTAGKDSWFVVQPVFSPRFSLLLWFFAASLGIGAGLFFLLNQRTLKGGEKDGSLWLEHPLQDGVSSEALLTLLRKHLSRVTLVEATDSASVRSCCFSFSSAVPEEVDCFLTDMRRHFPSVHIRVQFNRSGEV